MGSKLDGDRRYAIKYSDIVVQSFHAVKNFTSGEGGAILFNNKNIMKNLKVLEHGFKLKVLLIHGVMKWIILDLTPGYQN